MFPKANYFLLEDPDIIQRVRTDPRSFLNELQTPVILDEIQNTSELFNYIRAIIDKNPNRKGRWILTGSQEASLMRGVTESMAGRICVLQLLPLSSEETIKSSILTGGFPEVVIRPNTAPIWFPSYIQTYLERDVRHISGIRYLATFRRFLSLLASRCSQMINRADLASAIGVSVPTISQWLSILEITLQIIFVPPFYENFGKRLIKSPKLYFTDIGLLCYLLGIKSEKELETSPFYGPIFKNYIASEIVKHQLNLNIRKEIYYFRDQQSLEVNFLIPKGSSCVMIEVKAARSVFPSDASNLLRLAKNMHRFKKNLFIIYRPNKSDFQFTAIQPTVKAVSLKQFFESA